MNKLHTAKALIERGFAVFPIQPGAKSPPLLMDWPQRAARTAAEAELYWSAMPDANVGIHCENLVVLDVDVRNDGPASLEMLARIYDVPATLTTITPTGGKHLFFRLPEGHPGVGNSAGRLGTGLDIKTTGGYVVAPGSDVEAGRYHFEADMPIAPAPDWLLDLLGQKTVRQRDTTPAEVIPDARNEVYEQAKIWLQTMPAGEGAFATACGLRDRGVSLEQALELMAGHDPRPNVPDKVHHAYRYAQGAPGSKAAVESDFPAPAPEPPPAPNSRHRPLRLDEVAASRRKGSYLVKGLLQRASYAEIHGAPGTGKTFVALDLGYHVAANRPWQGHPVKGGPVLYLPFEGMGGMVKRAQALRKHYGEEEVPFYIIDAAFNLRELEGRRALGEAIAAMPAKPALVIIDTFAHALRGGDENSAQDVGAFNTAVVELIKATGACVLIVHHTGKNKAAGARGSSALLAALDTEIEIADHQITATKQRDVELGAPLGFRLVPMPLGIDEDGDIETSCVVEPAEVPDVKDVKLRGNQQLAFNVLCRISPTNDPVPIEAWRAECAEFLGQRSGKKLYEIKMALVDKGLIDVDNVGMVMRRLE